MLAGSFARAKPLWVFVFSSFSLPFLSAIRRDMSLAAGASELYFVKLRLFF